jgi:hypothetical protein
MNRSRACLQIDFLGEPTTGNLHLVQRGTEDGAHGGVHALGLRSMGDVFEAPIEQLRARQQVRALARKGQRRPELPRGASLRMHDKQPCKPGLAHAQQARARLAGHLQFTDSRTWEWLACL